MPCAGIGPRLIFHGVRLFEMEIHPPQGVAALLASEPYYADAYLRQSCLSDTISLFTISKFYALQIAANWE